MNSINHHNNTAAPSAAHLHVRRSDLASVASALLCFTLSLGSSFAADTPIEVCKKKATTDYRQALRRCELSDRGFRPPVPNCRADAKSRYDTALSRCLTVIERKAGGGQRDFPKVRSSSVLTPPPPPPPKDPKPK